MKICGYDHVNIGFMKGWNFLEYYECLNTCTYELQYEVASIPYGVLMHVKWPIRLVTSPQLTYAVNQQTQTDKICLFLTFIRPCIASIPLKYNQQDATFSRYIYFCKLLYMFQMVSPPIIRSTKLYTQRQVLSNQYCCLLLLWMRWNYVPSHPTCRVIYRNKEIEKTLHLLGCILGKNMPYHVLTF
jgi:hypothetical protein